MTARLRSGMAFLLVASACNGALKFDEGDAAAPLDAPREAAIADLDASGERRADAPDAPDAAADSGCGDAACGWRMREEACAPPNNPCLRLDCDPGPGCTGMCGAFCSAECEPDSQCSLATGPDSTVACDLTARCTFVLGAGGRASCRADSVCSVRCQGRCTLDCRPGASCQLACGDLPLRARTGAAACP